MREPLEIRKRRRRREARASIGLFLVILAGWLGVLTVVFAGLFDDFFYRLTHPFDSGWAKGPWGFLFIYMILTLPVVPLHRWLRGPESEAKERARNQRRLRKERLRRRTERAAAPRAKDA